MAPCEKEITELLVGFKRRFAGGVTLHAFISRSLVCERVQVGENVIEEWVDGDDVPEGAELTGVVETKTETRVLVRKKVPVFETRCPESLLAPGHMREGVTA